MIDPELQALRTAVEANPGDDLPKLVLADWFDEHEEPERAELLRIEVEQATRGVRCKGFALGDVLDCLRIEAARRNFIVAGVLLCPACARRKELQSRAAELRRIDAVRMLQLIRYHKVLDNWWE